MASNSTGSIGDIRKKFHEIHELISTSYHEAGHTIYGLLHNMKIETVFVFEDKKSKRIEGFTHYNSITLSEIKDPELFNNRLYAEIGLSYAGLVAEKHYFKMISGSDKFPIFLRIGSSHDIKSASDLFQKNSISEPGRKRYQSKKKIMKEINKELQDNWDAVTLVAHALIKKKKLYFPDLVTLLSKKADNREFWKNQMTDIAYMYNNIATLDDKTTKSILSL
jgi:hypothetical protein